MDKPRITKAQWISNNEFEFIYHSPLVVGKTPEYCESRVKQLFSNNKYLAEAKLRGWDMRIRALHYDHDPECDCLDVVVTVLHTDIDTIALESRLIHKMLNNTPLQFLSATDTRSLAETFEELA
jgi:hypothetical protein